MERIECSEWPWKRLAGEVNDPLVQIECDEAAQNLSGECRLTLELFVCELPLNPKTIECTSDFQMKERARYHDIDGFPVRERVRLPKNNAQQH